MNKRNSKNPQFEAVKEEVFYLCSAWFDHGHWVRKEGEPPMVTRHVLQRLETPPTAARSIAHEKDALNQVYNHSRKTQGENNN